MSAAKALRRALNTDTYRLVKAARKQGAAVELTSNGHLRFRYRGRIVAMHGTTSSDRKSLRALTATLRRAGLEL